MLEINNHKETIENLPSLDNLTQPYTTSRPHSRINKNRSLLTFILPRMIGSRFHICRMVSFQNLQHILVEPSPRFKWFRETSFTPTQDNLACICWFLMPIHRDIHTEYIISCAFPWIMMDDVLSFLLNFGCALSPVVTQRDMWEG